MKSSRPSSNKMERKTVEKNRRLHMKNQCLKLASLVPSQHHTKVELTQVEQVDLAIEYIRKLKVSIEELKRKRDSMIGIGGSAKDVTEVMMVMKPQQQPPTVEVRDFGSTLGVIIITESDRKFMTSDVVTILVEHGADVMSVSFSFIDDKVIHIINCQATTSRVGFESETVSQKLKELIF